jgi:hypothetical protein
VIEKKKYPKGIYQRGIDFGSGMQGLVGKWFLNPPAPIS